MPGVVNVNGRIVDETDAVISVFDHGFLYGEGVYEVLRTYHGEPFLVDRHLRRLRRSAEAIALEPPLTADQFGARVRETIRALPPIADGPSESYVRIILTRGVGDFGYDPTNCPAPTVLVIVKPLTGPPAWYAERGIKLALVSIVRNHPGSVNPLIKSNNLLNNALAMQEALRKGASEGLMKNYSGEIAECSQSNIFVVMRGTVATPPLGAGLLAGITREFLLEIGPEVGFPVEERPIHEDELYAADEAFITGTTFEVTPVVRVDDHQIGNGIPGAVAKRLLDAYRRKADELARRSSALAAPR
jgi:branched-chain amino acid aminotransferase